MDTYMAGSSDEDAADVQAARESRDCIEAGEPIVPWDDVKARLDLDD